MNHPIKSYINNIREYAPIVQLDRMPDFESVGCRFDSYSAHVKNLKFLLGNKKGQTVVGHQLSDPKVLLMQLVIAP